MPYQSFFWFVLVSIYPLAAAAGEKPWVEIRSPHFRVLTNGSAGDARKVAYEFEQLRYIFSDRFPNTRVKSAAPLLVFAVRDEGTAKALEPRWNTRANRAGEFHHGWEKQYAIVRLDTWGGERSKEVVYHEYTHSIEHMNSHYLPVWLDEGIAEFYAYTRFEQHRIYVGAPTERYRTLRSKTPIPVETFISLNHRSPDYVDGSKNQLFYAEAWALVHFLIYGPGMENGKRLNQFLGLLQQGVQQKKAFQQVFGDFKNVDNSLNAYMHQVAFTTAVLKDPPTIDDQLFSTRTMGLAETEAELGCFHIRVHDWPGAHKLIEQALADDPKLGLAHEDMGFLDFAEGKDTDAEKEFFQAYTLDKALYLSFFYQNMLSPFAVSNKVSDMKAFAASLHSVLQLNPEFAPAYVQLAELALREGDLASALQSSRQAEELEPSLAGYHLLTGRILQRIGKTAAAADYAKFVADRWTGPDHDEAVELWNSLPAEGRPTLEPVSETIPKDTQTAEGTIKSVACGDQGQGSFVLDHNGHLLTFHRKAGEFESGFSDTIWYGADHFSLCHHLVGTRAVVRYHLPSDSTYAGDIVEMGIRDDLPQDFHQTANSPTITSATP